MSLADGIAALEKQYDQMVIPAAIGLLEWALGTIDEINGGEPGPEWDEDRALYLQARDMVKTFRAATGTVSDHGTSRGD